MTSEGNTIVKLMMNIFWRSVLVTIGALALSACAGLASSRGESESTVLLQLSPSTLGSELSMTQRMRVHLDTLPDTPSPELDVALEADAASVRLAILQLNHAVARFEWDGKRLSQQVAPGWPRVVSAQRVLSDIQMVWWPIAAIQPALPSGWTVRQSRDRRDFLFGSEVVSSVNLQPIANIELIHFREGYRVEIVTDGALPQYENPSLASALSASGKP